MKRYLIICLLFGCGKTHTELVPETEKYINVKDHGALGNGIADDTKAFELAMDKAHSLKQKIFIPNGVYKARIILSHDGLQLVGETQPNAEVNSGSVILGMINCDSKKNILISNLGIDSKSQLNTTDDAALSSGVAFDSIALHQEFKNLSIIGDGYLAYKHGILCYAGSGITLKNITVSYFYHGIAIRSSDVAIDTVYANYCGFTSIVIKSAEGLNRTTRNVSVNHVYIKGDPGNLYNRGGAVMVQSFDDVSTTKNVNIQDVTSIYGGVACILIEQRKGVVNGVTVKNCTSRYQGDISTRACYDIDGGTNITFSNCTANDSYGYGFRSNSSADNIRVENCFAINSIAGNWTGTFSYLQLNGIEIIK